jgi:RHS repeat-associated protein
VNYTYDVLNRLVQAGTMPFAYDGFGNLTQQGQTSLSVEPTTNRINSAGYQYNANGNVTQTPGPVSYSYDVANRLVSNGAIYNPRNQRVFDGTYIYLYTPEGKLAGKYQPAWSQNGSQAFIQGQPNVYFAGKLIQEQGQWVMTDRLGSVRLRASGERSSYQPYGAEVAPATSDQRTKFATYYRDSAGLDYAGQRYYSNVTGRFLTPDPGGLSTADPKDPGSWNRYAYVGGDPVNFRDPQGLFRCLNCDDNDGGALSSGWPSGPVHQQLLGNDPLSGYASEAGGPNPSPAPRPDCDSITAAVGFAGLNYSEATEVWNDLASTNGINNVAVAALGVVTWAGEAYPSFARNPINNGNSNGSVDIGPFQVNYQVWKSGIPADQQSAVFGTNLLAGQVFNGNTDANIIAGLKYLNSLYGKFGDQAAGLYTGRNNPDRPKRQATFDAYSQKLETLFSNKDCFPNR